MTVAGVSGDAQIVTPAANINRYNANSGATRITVPARSSTIVTIAVNASAADFDEFEEFFPNGMFLEGFIWFEAAGNTPVFESVNIPFMGFYGCWNDAPIFDLADAYTDISGLAVTDEAHPMFHTAAMHGTVPRDRSNDGAMLEICDLGEIVLGANQFAPYVWGGYAMVGRGTTQALTRPGAPGGASTGQTATLGGNLVRNARTYMNNMRAAGHLNRDFIAFSPGEDSLTETVYANLMLLRNAKAISVVIRDAEGDVVNILGPEFDFFRTRTQYDHAQWHWAAMHGGRHFRNMGWDGTDFEGNVVPDGQYFYEVRAMLEYEFLAMTNENPGEPTDEEALTQELLNSPTVQYKSFPVLIDTSASAMTAGVIVNNTLTVEVTDTGGIQAIGLFYNGELVGDVVLVSDVEVTHTFDLSGIANINSDLVVVQAVDFALNLATTGAEPNRDDLRDVLEDAEGLNNSNFSGANWRLFSPARNHAQNVLDNPSSTQAEINHAANTLRNLVNRQLP
jgi:hypothetical protein